MKDIETRGDSDPLRCPEIRGTFRQHNHRDDHGWRPEKLHQYTR